MDPVSKAQLPAKKHKTGFRGPSPDVGKATRWKPGQSGNPSGRPVHKPITEIFQELFDSGEIREEIKQRVRKTLTEKGMAGVLLLRESAERIEGKVEQTVELNVNVSLAERIAERRRKALVIAND